MSRSIDALANDGLLIKWTPDLGPRRMPQRRVFVTGEFEKWAESLSNQLSGSRLFSPMDELETVIAEFVAGEKLAGLINKIDPPAGEGLVKIHTSSFRLYGWAAIEHYTLVLTHGAPCNEVHGGNGPATKNYGKSVIAERKKLGVTQFRTGDCHEIFRVKN